MFKKLISIVFVVLVLSACQQTMPKDSFKLTPEAMQNRQIETRNFSTKDETIILSASAGVLQDLGYTLDESETKLGVIVASKDRKTDNKGQQYWAHTSLILGALAGVKTDPYKGVEDKQKIRVALVTKPDLNKKEVAVRVTFQRLVWDMEGNLFKMETLSDKEMYSGFFSKLSKSVFLEAHQI